MTDTPSNDTVSNDGATSEAASADTLSNGAGPPMTRAERRARKRARQAEAQTAETVETPPMTRTEPRALELAQEAHQAPATPLSDDEYTQAAEAQAAPTTRAERRAMERAREAESAADMGVPAEAIPELINDGVAVPAAMTAAATPDATGSMPAGMPEAFPAGFPANFMPPFTGGFPGGFPGAYPGEQHPEHDTGPREPEHPGLYEYPEFDNDEHSTPVTRAQQHAVEEARRAAAAQAEAALAADTGETDPDEAGDTGVSAAKIVTRDTQPAQPAVTPRPRILDRGTYAEIRDQLLRATKPVSRGQVISAVGLSIDVAGLEMAVGEAVKILGDDGPIMAEVVALHDGYASCMPVSDLHGVRAGNPAISTGGALEVPVGDGLIGRVVNALGQPIDGGPPLENVTLTPTEGTPPPAMERERIGTPMPLGVRAMDTLIPCGKGQRIGIFAGSGVGKSSLLSMIVRGSSAPVCVLALVGERGREVREFVEGDLGPDGMERSVVVVATSDEPALVRLRAASTATRIAEHFRDQGKDVILCMDSVTRVAMAQREVGLASGEPPATRGYPPSVFGLMPKLLERAGMAATGSITGLYTVLVDGDDLNDPIADNVRSILDGHVVLSRKLATKGHFPAIDVLESISRANNALTTKEQRNAATTVRSLMAAERDSQDLIDIGAYVKGSNPLVDRALAQAPEISDFLIQDMEDLTPYDESWERLEKIAAGG